ncbi:hypothetical protein GLE_1805 [Lysobacter enzymogenes]|uniref:Uncharacterized protein n=1 Tax=Lysobacter enzymogenes TaxID=69 RepID=A0A0S2DF06_LYSEN|nr:hypothetical protein GLE_1805 [Lysobacter enzymogenes]
MILRLFLLAAMGPEATAKSKWVPAFAGMTAMKQRCDEATVR